MHLSRFNFTRAIDEGVFSTNPPFDVRTKDRGRPVAGQAPLPKKLYAVKLAYENVMLGKQTLC